MRERKDMFHRMNRMQDLCKRTSTQIYTERQYFKKFEHFVLFKEYFVEIQTYVFQIRTHYTVNYFSENVDKITILTSSF